MRQLGSAIVVDFSLPVSSLAAGQILNVRSGAAGSEDSGEGAWLEITPERLTRTFILSDSVGQPLLRRYVRVGEVFQIQNYGGEQPLSVKQYDPSFSAALPPMTNPATLPPPARNMPLQDSSSIPSGRRIKLAGPGLYSLRVKGEAKPVGLLAESGSFPSLTSAVELIQPLIYLTTSAERQKLYNAPDSKKAVDRFWLDVAGGQQVVARQLIRTYYERVSDANRMFSSYKAGWMTDRGMLYVVYGPPETVYRTPTEERWIYREGMTGAGTYTFRPKPSTFAPEHYELVRRPEYEQLWYAAVEQWRKGLTAPTAR
jgi:GWxTD domain-containing protein